MFRLVSIAKTKFPYKSEDEINEMTKNIYVYSISTVNDLEKAYEIIGYKLIPRLINKKVVQLKKSLITKFILARPLEFNFFILKVLSKIGEPYLSINLPYLIYPQILYLISSSYSNHPKVDKASDVKCEVYHKYSIFNMITIPPYLMEASAVNSCRTRLDITMAYRSSEEINV